MSSIVSTTDLVPNHPTPGEKYYEKFAVTPELEAVANELISHYPPENRQSTVLPILHEVQKRFGYICGDSIIWTATMTDTTPAHVLGVVTFYPGLRQSCPGKFHIRVCRTLSCAMAGSEELLANLCKAVNIDQSKMEHHHPVGISPCGKFSVEFVECLAHCGFGPTVLVNNSLHEQVTPDKAQDLISKYQDKA